MLQNNLLIDHKFNGFNDLVGERIESLNRIHFAHAQNHSEFKDKNTIQIRSNNTKTEKQIYSLRWLIVWQSPWQMSH